MQKVPKTERKRHKTRQNRWKGKATKKRDSAGDKENKAMKQSMQHAPF